MAAPVSLTALIGRLVLSMAVVLVLMWLAARLLRSRGGAAARPRPGVPLEVLARQPLGRGASVALLRAGDRALVVGVTEHAVTVLSEAVQVQVAQEATGMLEPGAARTRRPRGEAPSPTWMAFVEALRERTARRS